LNAQLLRRLRILRHETSEGSWLFQILAEPPSQLGQFVGVGARDALPLQRLRCCLKDSLLNMTLVVFAADDKAYSLFSSAS